MLPDTGPEPLYQHGASSFVLNSGSIVCHSLNLASGYICISLSMLNSRGKSATVKKWTATPKVSISPSKLKLFLSLIGLDEVRVIIRTRKWGLWCDFYLWMSHPKTPHWPFSLSSTKTYQGKTNKSPVKGRKLWLLSIISAWRTGVCSEMIIISSKCFCHWC